MELQQEDLQARVTELERENAFLRTLHDSPTHAALRISEQRLSLALNVGGELGTWDYDIPGECVYADARFAEMFSLDPAVAAAGAPLSVFIAAIHPDDRAHVDALFRHALATGSDYSAEYRVLSRDGSIAWVYARARCHLDDAGHPTRFPGVVLDITERKRTEMMLAEKARLTALGSDVGAALAQVAALPKSLQLCAQAMVDHLDAAFARVWTLSPGGDVLELQASAGLYTHLDGPHARVPVGSFKIGRIARDRRPHLSNDVANDPQISDPEWARQTGMVAFAGYPLVVEDRLVGVLALFARHRLADDTLTALASVSASIGIGIERKHAAAALKQSAERYRFLAESMPQMVWTARPDGALDYVSAQVSAYFGLKSEDLLGQGWLAGVHPDDKAYVVERWRQALETVEPYDTEFRCRRASDGAWRWFLVRALAMANEGKVVCWVGTCTDIHDKKQSEEALRRANRELEEFAYVSSHDLQEPLRMVNIYTHLILKRLGSEDEKLNQYAEFVRQGVSRMATLLDGLLTFSRTVHTEEDSCIGTADLSAALNEALSVLRIRIEENAAVVRASTLPVVRGDTAQLSHVFENLLSNALKYRNCEQCPEIHINAEPRGEQWLISVRDNGIGFEAAYSERIFGLFKRLYKNEYPGTGLGLPICRRIVERYGGRIWAEGSPGEGATFYMLLPAATSV